MAYGIWHMAYGAGHEMLGLRRGIRVIGCYIDTGKNIKINIFFHQYR